MARIRTIKPELWMSAQVMNLEHSSRLLFLGLITQADDEGRGSADPRRLKASIFGGDDVTSADVRRWLDEISKQRLAIIYNDEKHGLLYALPSWSQHQSIDRPRKSVYPPPPESAPIQRTFDELDTKPREGPDRTVPDRKDRTGSLERTGPEGSTTAAARPAANGRGDEHEFETFKATYPERNGSQPWDRARKAINASLRKGYTWEQILDGTRRYAAWCEATGKIGTETVKQAATFAGPEHEFTKPWNLPRTKAETRLAGNLAAADEFMRRTETGT